MTETTEILQPHPQSKGPIVAKAGRYYRWARYLMMAVLIVYGGWSIYDGFVSWPRWPQTHPLEKPKTPMDILINKCLGVVLPPLGIFVLITALRKSRGEYRLEDGVIHVPGHPAIPLEKIQSVDRQLWDRKGIARVEYDLHEAAKVTRGGGPVSYQGMSAGQRGSFMLDDFVYDRQATDLIFKAIEESLLKAASAKPPIQPVASKLPPRPRMGSNL